MEIAVEWVPIERFPTVPLQPAIAADLLAALEQESVATAYRQIL